MFLLYLDVQVLPKLAVQLTPAGLPDFSLRAISSRKFWLRLQTSSTPIAGPHTLYLLRCNPQLCLFSTRLRNSH